MDIIISISDDAFDFDDLDNFQIYQLLQFTKCLLRHLASLYPDDLFNYSYDACKILSDVMSFVDDKLIHNDDYVF